MLGSVRGVPGNRHSYRDLKLELLNRVVKIQDATPIFFRPLCSSLDDQGVGNERLRTSVNAQDRPIFRQPFGWTGRKTCQ